MFSQDSILSANIASIVSTTQPHEWDATGWVPDKPAHWEYGYVIKGQTFSSTREQLPKLLEVRGGEVNFVWTPETPEPVFPERVPFLVEAFRRIQVREARHAILISVGLLAFAVLSTVLLADWSLIARNIFFVFGAVGLTEGIWRYKLSRNYSQEDATRDASSARFAAWLEDKSPSRYTYTLCAFIVVVVVCQAFAGMEQSVAVAALVKPAVWDGQIWRLFTATLMHASLEHFLMNFYALVHVSKVVEQTLERALVPPVFLVSGAVGSIFSVLLYPHTTSVGASGGILGLLGFITITAYLDRTKYPPKYFRLMIQGIVLIGAFGLFGFAFIDNAAHLGGLVGGAVLGWLFSKRNQQQVESTSRMLKFGGVVALGVLAVVAATAIFKLIGY